MIYFTPWNSDISSWPDYWGILDSPRRGLCENIKGGRIWAGDNDAFTGNFDEDRFFSWLEDRVEYQDTCKFIACPDVWGDKEVTMERWCKYSDRIRDLGYPVAFVVQDNQQLSEIPDTEAIFIGGTDNWRQSKKLKRIVSESEKWVHVGRVNSQMRINRFKFLGADSVDGTCLQFGPDKNRARLERALMGKMLF